MIEPENQDTIRQEDYYLPDGIFLLKPMGNHFSHCISCKKKVY